MCNIHFLCHAYSLSKLYANVAAKRKLFLWYLPLDFTSNCICEIYRLALDGFYISTVHLLSSKEKKYRQCWYLNPRGNQEYFLCAIQPPKRKLPKQGFEPNDICADNWTTITVSDTGRTVHYSSTS